MAIKQKIVNYFPFTPTESQAKVMQQLEDFLSYSAPHAFFILRGYAGTGKSTLVGAFARMVDDLGIEVRLLAPTGRAAKVLQGYCGLPAGTIHRMIYRERIGAGGVSAYELGYNKAKEGILYIVDEASMISNVPEGQTTFGSGCLLDDLMEYCCNVSGSKILFVGDDAQLPPVGTTLSPALSEQYLGGYGYPLFSSALTDIVRQESAGEIVLTSYELRTLILKLANDHPWVEPLLSPPASGGEITVINGRDLPAYMEDSFGKVGEEETVLVTRSNRDAEGFNRAIRHQSLYYEGEVLPGEQVMAVRNNYLHFPTDPEGKPAGSFVANGELLRVISSRNEQKLYGFTFRDVELEDSEGGFVDAKVMLDSLYSGAASLTAEQRQALFDAVCEDYPECTSRRALFQKLRKDPYLNALQIKYAYAMTVHKAQGGQWRHVYLSFGYLTPEMIDLSFCRWLYTAITRASEHLYIINPPDFIFGRLDEYL